MRHSVLFQVLSIFQNNERPVSAYDQVAFPKVRVNEEVQVAGKKCQLRKTDYYYMTFSGKLTNPKKEPNVAFTYKDLPIQLTFVSYDIDKDSKDSPKQKWHTRSAT